MIKKKIETFRTLKTVDQIQFITTASRSSQKEVFTRLMEIEQLNLLEHLDPNDATDLLQLLPEKARNKLLEKLDKKFQEAISVLLQFDPDTAAGLMSLDYIQVDERSSLKEVTEKVRVHEERTGRMPTILIMQNGKLIGHLPIYRLALGNLREAAGKFARRMNVIRHAASMKEVIKIFQRDPHGKVAVLNEDKVLGIVYAEDVLGLINQQRGKSLYEFAGLNEEETVFDNAGKKFHFRYKWLIINLATAFLAAFTVGLFEGTIAKHVLLAVYMPIVAGMGGNAATQTLAVMIRGLAFHDLKMDSLSYALKNEVIAGFLNGAVNGVIVFVIVYLFNNDAMIGIVLALAMVINLVVAAIFGTLVPYVMQKLGKDPASSATIFITTATDVLGFLADRKSVVLGKSVYQSV